MKQENITDAELAVWLNYVKAPPRWQAINPLRRQIGAWMAKGKKAAGFILVLVIVLLLLRTALLINGLPLGSFDLVIGMIIGALLVIAYLMG